MNRGLKSYTKQLTLPVGNTGSVSVNLNKEDSNIIVELPLFKKQKPASIGLSLIYNHQNRNETSDFGSGMKLNVYRRIESNGNVTNADGAIDYYQINVENKETQCTLRYKNGTDSSGGLEFVDKYGNISYYKQYGDFYPNYIKMIDGTTYYFEVVSNRLYSIWNGRGRRITFNFDLNGCTSAMYTYKDTKCAVVFNYTSNKLTEISYALNQNHLWTNEMIFADTKVALIDYKKQETLRVTTENGVVNSISKYTEQDSDIDIGLEYDERKTTVTDLNTGAKTYHFFDSNGIMLYEMDEDYFVSKSMYDLERKRVTFSSSLVNAKNKEYNLFEGITIKDFTKSDSSIQVTEEVIPSNSFYYPVLGDDAYRVSGTGTLTYQIPTNGLELDNLMLVMFGKQLSPFSSSQNVEVKLYCDSTVSDNFKKEEIDNEYDLIMLGRKAEKSYSSIKVEITLNNSTIILGGFQVLKKDFGSIYKYDTKGNVAAEIQKSGTNHVSYNTNNLPQLTINCESLCTSYEYDENNNVIKESTNLGCTTTNEYENNQLIKSVKENSSKTKVLEVTNTYDQYNNLIKKVDGLENAVNYEYDLGGNLLSVIDTLGKVSYEYGTTLNVVKKILTNASNNSSLNVEYTYDNYNRITKAELSNGGIYEFIYNKNNLESIKLNGNIIFRYTYDEKNRITSQMNGSTGDGYCFTYDTNDRVEKVYYKDTNGNEILKYQYVYDNSRLVAINDGENIIKEYTYDSNDNVINVSANQTSISYKHNSLGEVINEKREVLSKKVNQSYDLASASKIGCSCLTHGITSLHTANEYVLNMFDIYPLQNSLESLNGKKPIVFNLENEYLEKTGIFKYDELEKHNCYVADGKELIYRFGNSNEGTIMLRVNFQSSGSKKYVLQMQDTNNQRLSLYLNSTMQLFVNIDGEDNPTNITCNKNKWYTIALSYSQSIAGDSSGSSTCIRIYVHDGTQKYVYNCTCNADSFGLMTTMVGRQIDRVDFDDEETTVYPVIGFIEKIAVSNAYCEESTLGSLRNELNEYFKTTAYDEFGRVYEVDIHRGGNSILTNTYLYKTRDSKYTSSQVNMETIEYGYNETNRIYTTDARGNVTSIIDSTFGSHTYEYDYRGFLTKEDNTNYTYDDNGNILSAGNTTFTYDSTIKDRLDTVNGDKIYYSATDSFKPRFYKGYEYQFEGRKLVSLSEAVAIDEQKTVDYTYDDQGLIIKRVVGYWYSDDRDSYEEITNYYYDGDKLITEVTPYHRNDYLYDENGQVYGFIQDNNTKYFYVKDFMQNILGLVDINGKLVVKYSYDAYGKLEADIYYDNEGNVSSNRYIYNPIRYKGYYYDYDVDMYYCKTRFYVPKWRRWLIYDSSQYLDVENIGCVNLFSYCNNNPVMYSDGDGHMPQWAKWLIGGAVIVGLGIATIATGGAAGGVAGFVLAGALKGAVVGAVSGALVSGTIGGISSAISGDGFWHGFADGAADGFMSGAVIGGITGAISSGVQIHNASKLWANTGNKSAYRQMIEHYSNHVIKEGQKSVAKNIVNYSKQASQFYKINSAKGYLLRDGVVKIAGAPGGIFNVDGLIRSFWYILK